MRWCSSFHSSAKCTCKLRQESARALNSLLQGRCCTTVCLICNQALVSGLHHPGEGELGAEMQSSVSSLRPLAAQAAHPLQGAPSWLQACRPETGAGGRRGGNPQLCARSNAAVQDQPPRTPHEGHHQCRACAWPHEFAARQGSLYAALRQPATSPGTRTGGAWRCRRSRACVPPPALPQPRFSPAALAGERGAGSQALLSTCSEHIVCSCHGHPGKVAGRCRRAMAPASVCNPGVQPGYLGGMQEESLPASP